MRLEFDWDPAKGTRNLAKHGVSFDQVMPVFRDVLSRTLFDEEHSAEEERWITIGLSGADLLLVVHTLDQIQVDLVAIRIISARRPTARERRDYLEGTTP